MGSDGDVDSGNMYIQFTLDLRIKLGLKYEDVTL